MSKVGNTPGVNVHQLQDTRSVGTKLLDGLKSIGRMFSQFGSFLSQGLASILGGLGKDAANATAHTGETKSGAVLKHGSAKFSQEEMTTLKEQALESKFYKSMEGSGDFTVNQKEFRSLMDAVLTTPATVAEMKKHGVTLDEAIAISMYTSQAYVKVNGSLRNADGDPAMIGLADAFRSGLEKLPSFTGNPVKGPDNQTYYQCFRGAKLPEDVGRQHLEGDIVADRGIMSSTFNEREAFPNVNYSITLLLKPGSQGKDISAFSDKPPECEVAFPPGVEFQVVSRHIDTGGLLPPEMERTFHPKFQGEISTGTVDMVMKEV